MTTQQTLGRAAASGVGRKTRTSYINHENTLSAFDFPTTRVATEPFEPVLSAAQSKGESWLGLNFFSKFDGVQGAAALRSLVRLRIAVALDVSGSMASSFDNDSSHGSWGQFRTSNNENAKLEVAKQCLLAVAKQLEPGDELGVVLFNHDQEVLMPLTTVGANPAQFRATLAEELKNVHSGGGTDLAGGFQAALHLFGPSAKPATNQTARGGKGRKKASTTAGAAATSSASGVDSRVVVSRVLFLTDMQSGQNDEDEVLALASGAAATAPVANHTSSTHSKSTGPIFTSITGIGVDLSVGAVRALSQTPGGRYASVASAAEFKLVAGANTLLVPEVAPVAFGITAAVGMGNAGAPAPSSSSTSSPPPPPPSSGPGSSETVRFEAGCGHPEAAAVKPGDKQVTFSSEFAASAKGDPPILLRLSGCDQARGFSGCLVKFTWRNFDGSPGEATISAPQLSPSVLPMKSSSNAAGTGNGNSNSNSNNEEGVFSDLNLRKALALVRFVDFQEEYMTQDNNASDDEDDDEDGHQSMYSLGASMAPFRRYTNVSQPQQGFGFRNKRKAGAPHEQGAIQVADRLATRAMAAEDWSKRAATARATLLTEVEEVCGDASVAPGGSNQAFAETLQQIVDLELSDANRLRTEAASHCGGELGNNSNKNNTRSETGLSESGVRTRKTLPRKCARK